MTNIIVSFVPFAASVPTTTAVTFLVPDRPVDDNAKGEEAPDVDADADADVLVKQSNQQASRELSG